MKENNMVVSINLAKLARKKGFEEACNFGYCYDTTKSGYYTNYDPNYFKNSVLWENHYAAPTREQLQMWLQKQGVFVVVDVDQTLEPKFTYKINKHFGDGNWDKLGSDWSDLYYRYEHALEEGLTEALNTL